MTKNLDNEGLRAVVENYDFFFIDLWGVIHNGIRVHENAIKTLVEISNIKKSYILLTNAPRPNSTVKIFLKKNGYWQKYFGQGLHLRRGSFKLLKKKSSKW